MDVHNLIIIGSWPAWYTAAIYATRALLNPLLFEGYMAWWIPAGWQLTTTTTVYNYPGFPDGIDGPELMLRIKKQCQNIVFFVFMQGGRKWGLLCKVSYRGNLSNCFKVKNSRRR